MYFLSSVSSNCNILMFVLMSIHVVADLLINTLEDVAAFTYTSLLVLIITGVYAVMCRCEVKVK